MPRPEGIEPERPGSQAEVFDEENITEDGRDIATSDMQRDVYDLTSAPEDSRDALGPEDDFDPDAAYEADLEEIVMAEDDLDEPRSFARSIAVLVSDEDVGTADLEAGKPEERGQNAFDEALDRDLKATASRPAIPCRSILAFRS